MKCGRVNINRMRYQKINNVILLIKCTENINDKFLKPHRRYGISPMLANASICQKTGSELPQAGRTSKTLNYGRHEIGLYIRYFCLIFTVGSVW